MGLFTKKLTTDPYKGVRDFYPEDMQIENWMFGIMRKTLESFGYVEYGASILEPTELYRAKSGDEIVNEQSYNFKDRGGREVTLRPEMTPTIARMIAARERELAFPLRWYSIPNLFRYESPQRGRLREHWQLNADVFGLPTIEADIEVISIASKILKTLGAQDSDFEIRINSRKLINELYKMNGLSKNNAEKLSRLIDKKNKIGSEKFNEGIRAILGKNAEDFLRVIGSNKALVEKFGENHPEIKNIVYIIDRLAQNNIKNVVFDPTLMRGFEYYTGFVFEIFDTDESNKRSIFGGGRYDDILDIFGKRKIPAVGFGMGDVTTLDFLETHNLLPKLISPTDLYVCVIDPEKAGEISAILQRLRSDGVNVTVDWSSRKIGDQIKTAVKQKTRFIGVIGEDEIKNGTLKLKRLSSGEETAVSLGQAANFIIASRSSKS